MLESLPAEALEYGIRLSDEQVGAFQRYFLLLVEWSKRANLVGDTSEDVVLRRHFLESIALGAALREREILRPDANVLDLGAGAGFPGIVLKIVWPAIRLSLIEATAKKTAFLSAVVDDLVLADVQVLTGRAETLGHDPALRERFDLVVARAVAPLRVLVELALPFARVGGRLVTPKGSRAEAEVAAAEGALGVLGGQAFVVPFRVSGPPQRLVAVLKRRPTPPAYPRRPGIPSKNPLS
jgi:16S rRNA (guanine527-N7)-methyltransferase